MLRFAAKVGVAAGAVYYLNQEGIWKESQEALKAYDKLNKTMEPYVNQVLKQIPLELPQIPKSDTTSLKIYWNKGVMSTFKFLGELPDKLSDWSSQGIKAIMESPEMKKLTDLSKESKVAEKEELKK